MDYLQSKKTWFNQNGNYIIKTVYDPNTGDYTHTTIKANVLPKPVDTTLPQAILNDVLDWRNVIRDNRQKD